MSDFFTILGFTISFGLSLTMFYLRMKDWFKSTEKNIITILLAIIGIFGFALSKTADFRYLFYSMVVPIIYYSIDKLFRRISILIQGRDFYLYLQYSSDLENSKEKISVLDIVFTWIVFIMLGSLTLLGVVLFGKDDLYNKLIM